MPRSSVCELCGSDNDVKSFDVVPSDSSEDQSVYLCSTCRTHENPDAIDTNHWRCLNDSMWSEVDGVKVVAYRVLSILNLKIYLIYYILKMIY